MYSYLWLCEVFVTVRPFSLIVACSFLIVWLILLPSKGSRAPSLQ